MSPSDRVAQLYPQAPGYLYVSLYDSQGYGGGILTRLHTRIINLQENENVNTESDKWFIMESAWVSSYIT
jgi:hypothetical protein